MEEARSSLAQQTRRSENMPRSVVCPLPSRVSCCGASASLNHPCTRLHHPLAAPSPPLPRSLNPHDLPRSSPSQTCCCPTPIPPAASGWRCRVAGGRSPASCREGVSEAGAGGAGEEASEGLGN